MEINTHLEKWHKILSVKFLKALDAVAVNKIYSKK